MTREPPAQFDALPIEAGAQIAHLRHLLGLAQEMVQIEHERSGYDALDEAAQVAAAYDRALPVMQRRFDALAEEAATWAACAFRVLHPAEQAEAPPAAAAQLARELERAIRELRRSVQAP